MLDPDKARARYYRYYLKHRDKLRERGRLFYAKHRERLLERNREASRRYRKNNPEKVREQLKRSRQKPDAKARNRETVLLWKERNREKYLEQRRDYYNNHRAAYRFCKEMGLI
jgi:hypothetical protein